LGYVAVGRGEFDRARPLLEDALAVGRPTREAELILPPLWGLAELDLLEGRPHLAAAHAAEALALAESVGEGALLVPFLVTGARAFLADRRPEDARAWLDQAGVVVAAWETVARPGLDHADGLLRTAAGSTVGARESLEAAVRGWDAVGRTWESAWARLDLARCLARGNRVAAALEMLQEARAHAQRLGSAPLLARIDELARDVRGRHVDDEPWRPLTAREFEVARLIASGMTNGEIAAELSIATRTASAHVEHILAKLGLARRSEVAAWASRVGRDTARAGSAGGSTALPVGVRGR
jgi:DNA-binding CsgD family transcriptional regulator